MWAKGLGDTISDESIHLHKLGPVDLVSRFPVVWIDSLGIEPFKNLSSKNHYSSSLPFYYIRPGFQKLWLGCFEILTGRELSGQLA